MTLTNQTKVTLGTVSAVVIAVATATWTIKAELARINTKIDAAYTLTAASEAALRLSMENPGLRVPDPRDPARVFVVDISHPRTP